MTRLDECCATCRTCGIRTCRDGWPPNSCDHGDVVCDECRPGECVECAAEVAQEVAA